MAKVSRRRARSGKRVSMPRGERQHLILAAARSVFGKRGYHQTNVEQIVAEAGVARGTFYLYFEDKRAVFGALIDRFSARLATSIVRIRVDDPSRPVEDQVMENLRGILRTCLAERVMTRMLLVDAVGIDPAFDRRLQSFFDEMAALLVESLREGQALGIVREGEPRVLAHLAIGALKELLFQAVTLGLAEESAEALAQQVFGFLARGLLEVPD